MGAVSDSRSDGRNALPAAMMLCFDPPTSKNTSMVVGYAEIERSTQCFLARVVDRDLQQARVGVSNMTWNNLIDARNASPISTWRDQRVHEPLELRQGVHLTSGLPKVDLDALDFHFLDIKISIETRAPSYLECRVVPVSFLEWGS